MRFRLPEIDGLLACRVVLVEGQAATLLDALCAYYPKVPQREWPLRFAAGYVRDERGALVQPEQPFHPPIELHYYRTFSEEHIPFEESIVYRDERLVVVDKPHFLPVHPAGKYVEQTLVRRLIARLGNPELSPLHRLDRATAGLVLFSAERATRSRYQALFSERRIVKRYEALAPPLPAVAFPLERRSRLGRCDDGFRMREIPGEPNALTRVEVLDRTGPLWRYALYPHSGQMHQLRVHMAALGAPIANDVWYPVALPQAPDDYTKPLKLLAQSLSFVDVVDGRARSFESALTLD